MSSDRRRLAARMLCAGFTPENRHVIEALIDEGLGAVVLFSRNVTGEPEQVAQLVQELKQRAAYSRERADGGRLLVAIDHEGGRVQRLQVGFSPIPSMRDLGKAVACSGDLSLAREVGRIIGRELRAVGIDLNFAPVVDVDTNPANPVIGDRSIADEPCLVGEVGGQLVRGMQEEGVAACCKHFPGHGDTSVDSHLDLPRVEHDLDRLLRVEIRPFRAGVEAGVSCVMSAHVVVPALDPERAATMSRAILTGLLRDRIGFRGVVVSDDFEMKALAGRFDFEDSVVAGVEAGLDLVCICHSPELQHRAIEALSMRIPEDRLRVSAGRIADLCARFPPRQEPAELSGVGRGAHREFLARLEGGTVGIDPTEAWRG